MTRTLSSLALLLAIALGIVVSTPRTAPDLPAQSGAPENRRMPDEAIGGRVSLDGRFSVALAGGGGPASVELSEDEAGVSAKEATPTGSVGTALLGGWISWADPDLGGDYLATRFPRGTLVRLCTPNRCIVRRSNDFGPSAKIDPPRIADLAVLDWEQLTGLPRSRGVALGTIEAIEEIPLPPTDAVQ